MKKHSIFLTIACIIMLSSCEEESITQTSNPSTNFVVTHTTKLVPEEECCWEQNIFERQLHWASFFTGKTIRWDGPARYELVHYLNTHNTKRIPLHKMIGEASEMPNFKFKFEQFLWLYIHPSYPDKEYNNPGIPIVPTPFAPLTYEEQYQMYLKTMLGENCVEIYFPNGLDLFTVIGISNENSLFLTSTAHPLTNAISNEGFRRDFAAIGETWATTPVVVNDFYKANNKNLIVARPYRSYLSNNDCLYPEYDHINFQDYLD